MLKFLSAFLVVIGLHTQISASERMDTSFVKESKTCVVDGKVLYYVGNRNIRDAKIRLVDKSGREYVTASDMTGLFQFKSLPAGDYELTASHMGYDTFTSKYSLTEGRCVIYIRLKPSEDMIEGASVIAEAALLRQIADTTIYNAAALRTDAWADALELLKQIPGATVSSNGIRIHGEPVARTFVNGTLVFGDNPITAFKQLMASDVTHIKVYDEIPVEDKLAGKKNSRKERILNVITKDKINMALRGEVRAGGGLDQNRTIDGDLQPRYGIKGSACLYSEMLQIETRGGTNNLGEVQPENFSPERNKPLSSYSENSLINFHLIKYWGERMLGNNLMVFYTYGKNYDKSRKRSSTDYFETEESPAISFRDTSENSVLNKSHALKLDLHCVKTKIGTIHLATAASIRDNSHNNIDNRLESFGSTLNTYSENSSHCSKPAEVSTTLRWNNKFGNIHPHISFNVAYTNIRNVNSLIDTLGNSTYPKRSLNGNGKEWSLYGDLTTGTKVYLTNTDKQTIVLDMAYEFTTADNDNNTATYNSYGVVTPVIDPTNTCDYRWRTQSHALDVALFRDTRLTNFEIHIRPILKTSLNSESYPAEYKHGKTYPAICPAVSFIYKKRMKMAFSTDTSVPTMEQTRPRINDLVQSRLTAGNPDLRQSYTSKLSLSYSTKPHAEKPFLESSIQAYVTASPVVSRMIFMTEDTTLEQYDGYVAKAGSLLTTYSNAPMMASVSFNTQISGQTNTRVPWLAAITYTYRYLPQYNSDTIIYLNEHTPTLVGRYAYLTSFGLKTNINGSLMYLNSRNNEGTVINEGIGFRGGLSVDWLFYKRFNIKCSYDVSVYHMLNRNTTNISHQMQAYFKYEVLKRRLYLTLSAHDILNTADSYHVSSTADRLVQTWTPAYGRYFLAGVIWNFRKNK